MPAEVEVSFSELDAYRQCRLKHQLAWIERWRQPEQEGSALSRGSAFHRILELHYAGVSDKLYAPLYESEPALGLLARWKPGEPGPELPEGSMPPATWLSVREILGIERQAEPREVAALVLKSGMFYDAYTGVQTEQQELLQWMYEGYVERYAMEDRTEWEILAIEHPVALWLPTYQGRRSTIKLKGKIDLIVREKVAGGIWIVDHKTCRNLPKGKDDDLDDQMGCYTYLLRRGGPDQRPIAVRGAIYNHVRTWRLKTREMDDNERFRRGYTVRTDTEIRTMAGEIWEQMRDAHKPRKRDAPRSPDRERCGWKCDLTEPCLAGRKGYDMRGMLEDMGFVQDFERH